MGIIEQDDRYKSLELLLQKVFDKQENIDTILKNMDKTLSQLNQTVVGNPTYGLKGIVSEIAELKTYVENDKHIKNKMIGGLVVIGTFWTFLLQYFINVFSKK
jgi:hypothetical protein